LMPTEPYIDFVSLAVVFILATLLGFASHAPGSIGVFDAAMLVALWQFDKEDLVAGLLLFRLLYYIVPFAISLAVLGVREIVLGMTAPDVPHVGDLATHVLGDNPHPARPKKNTAKLSGRRDGRG
jgi:glycosyltransferase 2 family protein